MSHFDGVTWLAVRVCHGATCSLCPLQSAGESVPAELCGGILPRQAGRRVQALPRGLHHLCRWEHRSRVRVQSCVKTPRNARRWRVVCCAPLCPSSIEKCVCFRLAAASGAGVEACNRCAEGYLMEEWRCVPSCSAGFYATEPNPEIADGHRICRRWAHWCVFRCGWFVYLLMAGLILVVGFCVRVLVFTLVFVVVCLYGCCFFPGVCVLCFCCFFFNFRPVRVFVCACAQSPCSPPQVWRQLSHLCGAEPGELQQLFQRSQPAGGSVCC